MRVYTKLMLTAVVIAPCLAVAPARADTISYNANLTEGVYYGSGNFNGGWTVDNNNGIELGVRASPYGLVQTPPNWNSDTYWMPTGVSPLKSTRGYWNYDFSVYLGSSGYTMSDVTVSMTITNLTEGATPLTFDVKTLDNATLSNIGLQNSENPIFTAAAIDWTPSANDDYQITMTVDDLSSNLLASDTIFVDVPEPTTLALVGGGLLGLGFLGRRRKQVQA